MSGAMVEEESKQSGKHQLTYLVNHPPAHLQIVGKKTQVYGFHGVLVEVVPDTDQIASLTLFNKSPATRSND